VAERSPARFPLTVSRPSLLKEGSDREFRGLIHNLLAYGHHLDACVDGFGTLVGLTGVQYEIVMALHRFREGNGICVGEVAEKLHRSGAFITLEINKLAAMGVVRKGPDPADRRKVLLELTAKGLTLIERLAPYQRQVNDALFACLDRRRFETLCKLVAELVACGDRGAVIMESLVRSVRSEAA
jgi:DNA-binding MarR family transcriptional regulator